LRGIVCSWLRHVKIKKVFVPETEQSRLKHVRRLLGRAYQGLDFIWQWSGKVSLLHSRDPEKQISKLVASSAITKKRCMVGDSFFSKASPRNNRIPYHPCDGNRDIEGAPAYD
jgi:hypothetical protein